MLIADDVIDTMKKVLFASEELVALDIPPPGAILVRGVTGTVFGLHPERLEQVRPAVQAMIADLPAPFTEGGGWSFLNMVSTRAGDQWGEQRSAEVLLILALGLRLARYCLPRSYWPVLPGSMPYVAFSVEKLLEPDPDVIVAV